MPCRRGRGAEQRAVECLAMRECARGAEVRLEGEVRWHVQGGGLCESGCAW